MFKEKSNSYYISDKFSNLWLFDHKSNNEIHYEVYNNKEEKIHSSVLSSESMGDFLVALGNNNDMHVVLKKISGELLYYFFNGKKWSILKLLELKNHLTYFHLLDFHLCKNHTHIIYFLKQSKSNDQWLFVDQYWENSKWNHLNFFQSTGDISALEYASISDSLGNIYFTFSILEGTEYQLHLCQFHSKVGLWDKKLFSFKKGNKFSPEIWITNNKNVHICWVYQREDGNYSICYRNKKNVSENSKTWGKEKEIYIGHSKIHKPYFGQLHNKLTIFWIEENKLYYVQSPGEGETWQNTPSELAQLNNPVFSFYLNYNLSNKNNSSYIILDKATSQMYPFKILNKKENNFKDFEFQTKYNNPPSKISPSTKKRPTLTLEFIKSIDKTNIQNLNEEKAKSYLLVFKEYLLKLYKENSKLKEQILLRNNPPASISKTTKPYHTPTDNNVNDNKKGIKEQLKTKIVEDENIKLKAEITDYGSLLKEMKKDLNNLKQEIHAMESKNNNLRHEISQIKENSISKKIKNFFIGDK